MYTFNATIHFFEIEIDKKTLFIEDMHERSILCNNDSLHEITFSEKDDAIKESNRLNSLKLENLTTKVIGIPWRILLEK